MVKHDVLCPAGDGVALLHTIEVAVSHRDVLHKRVFLQSDDLYTVF